MKKATYKDLALELWLRQRESGKIIWTTKKGTQIDIKAMSDEHIINCLKHLTRKSEIEEILAEGIDY